MSMLKKLFKMFVNKETITYLIFGVMTTVVNFGVFKAFDMLFERTFSVDLTLVTNVIAWVIAVAFAYVTNKLFVFESKSWAGKVVRKEIPEFVGARLLSFGIEELGLFVSVTLLGFDSYVLHITDSFALGGKFLTKIVLAVIGIILNYVFSKFIIFGKKDNKNENVDEGEQKK